MIDFIAGIWGRRRPWRSHRGCVCEKESKKIYRERKYSEIMYISRIESENLSKRPGD